MRPNPYAPTQEQIARDQEATGRAMLDEMVNNMRWHGFRYPLANLLIMIRPPTVLLERLQEMSAKGEVNIAAAALEVARGIVEEAGPDRAKLYQAVTGNSVKLAKYSVTAPKL